MQKGSVWAKPARVVNHGAGAPPMYPGEDPRKKRYPSVDGIRPARRAKIDPGPPSGGPAAPQGPRSAGLQVCRVCVRARLPWLGGERFLNPPPQVTAASGFLAARPDSPRNAVNSTPQCFLCPYGPNRATAADATESKGPRADHNRPQPPPAPAGRAAPAAETAGAGGAVGAVEKEEGGTAPAGTGHLGRQAQRHGGGSSTRQQPRPAAAASERLSNRRQYLRGAVGPAQMSCELAARCVTTRPNGNRVH